MTARDRIASELFRTHGRGIDLDVVNEVLANEDGDGKPGRWRLPKHLKPTNFKAPCLSGKTRHKTKKHALSSRNRVIKSGQADFIRIYKCRLCGDFHLTSQADKRKSKGVVQ